MRAKVKADIPRDIHEKLADFPELLRKLLFYRDIKTAEEAKAFLSPEYQTGDPFLLKDMTKAVSRISEALKKGERITVFADYDADGIPGAVVINDFFRKIGFDNFDVYIPNRDSEGFGLNERAVRDIADRGTALIITVDCGIADEKEAILARELGVDLIITDHHTPIGEIPSAVAVIDPKQADCSYPFKDLCGAGVAFKLVEAMISWPDFFYPTIKPLPGWEKWLLDMVGIATLSDMVPLVGENRIFAKYGLKVVRKSPRPGLSALFGILRINRLFISEDDVVFSISPRLNAASRMGEPMDAFKLLTTRDESEAGVLARLLDQLNNERKTVVAGVIKEAKRVIKERNLSEKKVIVLGNPFWKPALLGLSAGMIAEEYGRPVFLWGRDTETTLKGSCRGGGGINILEVMKKASEVFLEYGGHAGAGGFSVAQENIHRLEIVLNEAVSDKTISNGEDFFEADALIGVGEVDSTVFGYLESLSPFGEKNEKPIFLIENVLVKSVRSFGKNKAHTAIRLDKDGLNHIEAISFFSSPDSFSRPISIGSPVSMLVHLEKSYFNGVSEARLRVKEII